MGSGSIRGSKRTLQLLCSMVFTLGLLCLLAYAASSSSQVGPAATRRAPGPPAGPSEIRLDQDKEITSSTGSGSSSTKSDALHKSPSSAHMSSPADLPPHAPSSAELDHSGISSTATSVAAVPKVRPDVANGADETICTNMEIMKPLISSSRKVGGLPSFQTKYYTTTNVHQPELSILETPYIGAR